MNGLPKAATLPLRTVSRLTGLTPDILRAWEKRYQVVAPIRGPRGARLYTREDVFHLQLLAGAVAAGRSIGDVAKLDRLALEELLAENSGSGPDEASDAAKKAVATALEALEHFDPTRLHQTLSDAMMAFGIMRFIHAIGAPLLTTVGSRWSDGSLSIADEHLLTGSLRGLLGGLLHSRQHSAGPRIVFGTPSGEHHEFGILMTALIAADTGLGVAYLGPNLPAADIIEAADRCDASAVALSVVNSANHEAATREIQHVATKLGITTELWIGGGDATAVSQDLKTEAVFEIPSFEAARAAMIRLRASSLGSSAQ